MEQVYFIKVNFGYIFAIYHNTGQDF